MTALLLVFTLFLMTACGTSTAQTLGTTFAATPGITQTSTISASAIDYSQDDLDPRWSASSASSITLNGQSVLVSGTGATATGSKVTITSAGTYVISGKLSDGQVIVNTESEENVRIVLNGAEITCAASAPVYVEKAKKVILILADGTQNTLTDGTKYTYASAEETEPDAALFSKADLTINGTGTLTVKANYNDGIASKDELKIVSGTLVIQSVGDGIRGRDFIAVKDGLITIQSTGDGLKSTNDVDAAKGDIAISGGTLKITSGGDGIQ
ncbi:MAG TPA: carbohydrate-binding domain-containing protein, partial [Clostridia bacterium]